MEHGKVESPTLFPQDTLESRVLHRPFPASGDKKENEWDPRTSARSFQYPEMKRKRTQNLSQGSRSSQALLQGCLLVFLCLVSNNPSYTRHSRSEGAAP